MGLFSDSPEPWALRVARVYIGALHYVRYPLIITWTLLMIGVAFIAVQFPSHVTQSVSPPTNSQAYRGITALHAAMPTTATSDGFVVFVRSNDVYVNFGTDANYIAYETEFMYWLNTFTFPNTTNYTVPKSTTPVDVFASYRSSIDAGVPRAVYEQYMSKGNYSCFYTMSFNRGKGAAIGMTGDDFIDNLANVLQFLLAKYDLESTVVTTPMSVLNFLKEIQEATLRDVAVMFGVVLPLALLAFGVSVQAVRFLILPIAALVSTICITFAVMDAVARATPVNSLAPGIAAAICLALSVTFTYTMVCKFRREMVDQLMFGGAAERSFVVLELVMAYSGRTVLVSSLSVAFCSLGLIFFPIEMLRSIGFSCLTSAVASAFVVLNLIPTLLITSPEFYAAGVGAFVWPTWESREEEERQHSERHARHMPHDPDRSAVLAAPSSDDPLRMTPRPDARNRMAPAGGRALSNRSIVSTATRYYSEVDTEQRRQDSVAASERAAREVSRVRFFYRHFTAFLCQTRVAAVCAILCLGLIMYPVTQAFSTTYSNDITQFVPRDSKILPEWDHMTNTFGAGEVFQYNLVISFPPLDPNKTFSIFDYLSSPTDMPAAHAVIHDLVTHVPDTLPSFFDSFFFDGAEPIGQGGGNITAMDYFACGSYPANETARCRYLTILYIGFAVGCNSPTTYALTRVDFNPLSPRGIRWYNNVLDRFPALEAQHNIKLYLAGYPADTIDTVRFAEQEFPLVVGVVSTILFVVVAVLTLSLGVPLRTLISVFLTSAATYGMGNIVFVQGNFWWLPIKGLQGAERSVAWLMPFAVLMLVIAIALHYDMSMVLRVQQYHHHGYVTRDAIVRAATETGSEITVSAGLMMLLFAGLLFSEVPAMNQLGFYLMMSAFLSGLFMRLFLTTTVMSLLDEWNWFPLNLIRPRDDELAADLLAKGSRVQSVEPTAHLIDKSSVMQSYTEDGVPRRGTQPTQRRESLNARRRSLTPEDNQPGAEPSRDELAAIAANSDV